MNWRLALPLGALGPLMGTLVVLGVFPEGTDNFAWFGVVVLTALLAARSERERALFHGVVIGFWNGASATLVQAFLFDTTVQNNPWIVEKFADQPPGFDLEFFYFMLVPFIGVAGGAMTGLVAMLAARVLSGAAKPDAGESKP